MPTDASGNSKAFVNWTDGQKTVQQHRQPEKTGERSTSAAFSYQLSAISFQPEKTGERSTFALLAGFSS